MPLAPGSRLGRYVITRQLGAGAMGEVYLAEDPHIERRVAIKTIRLDVQEQLGEATGRQLALRFEREAKLAGRLVHPHIVTLFDAGDVDGLFYLAFEFIDGPDLAARARQQPPLTLRDVLRIGREAASALDAAHRAGIIHRDIKPSNLLMTSDGSLKIGDFGIATLAGQGTHLTRTGSLIGTPQYLSPEQVKTDVVLDGRSDLFSMGVVLYELLAGRRPFEGASMAALLFAVVSSEPVPLRNLRPDLPPRLTSAVMRLLEKEPEDRFPTAAALASELAAIERDLADPVDVPGDDELPTVVTGNVAPPTTPATTQPAAIPATLHQMQPEAATAIPPPVQPSAPAVPRRAGRFAIGAVAAVVLLGGVAAMLTLASRDEKPEAAAQIERPVAAPSGETVESSPVSQPVSPSEAETDSGASPETDPAPDYVVGGAVTFQVSPAEAAERAVVTVDGLFRGLAAGSMMTIRPGMRTVEIKAEGFETARLIVESRPGAAPAEVSVTLKRQ